MPSLDTVAAIVMATVTLLAVWVVCHTEPGAGPRHMQARRYHRAGLARHARTSVPSDATTPMPVPETVPDTAVSLFAARTA